MYRVKVPGVKLAVMGRPRSGEWLEDEISRWKRLGVDVVVCLLEKPEAVELGLSEERALVEANGIAFWDFPIPDRGVPDRVKLKLLIDRISDELKDGRFVAIHCRAGIGRTGLVAACALKAVGISSLEAINLVGDARGVPVPDTEEQLRAIIDYL